MNQVAAGSKNMRKLGELLVEESVISQDIVNQVLQNQRESTKMGGQYRLFGQICVEMGVLTHERLQQFLRKHNKSILLGDLLVNMRRLMPADLNRALKLQKEQPKRKLGEILIEQQCLSEHELMEALSMQLGVPLIQPAVELMDVRLLDGLDLKYVVDHSCLPISATESEVTVIMSDPLDSGVAVYLEKHFRKRVSLGIGSAAGIRETLRAIYEQRKNEHRAIRMDDIDPYEGEDNVQLSKVAGLSMYGGDEEEPEDEDMGGLTAALSKLGKDQPPEPEPAAQVAAQVAATVAAQVAAQVAASHVAEPPAPPAPAPKPVPAEPEVKEDTLIVGGVSLSSKNSAYAQQEGMLNYLINSALVDKASAIHIEPQGAFIRVRYRINGVLHQKTSLPATLGNPMVARLKTICALNPDSSDIPQRNRVQASYNDQEMELGIATYPSVHGETMVLSLRHKQGAYRSMLMTLEQTGLSAVNLWRFKKVLSKPGGLVIVTGPARSGKTTTAYAALSALNLLTRSISTAECPIEQTITGITQGNWTPERGISFAEMIRSMSFLDPDVLMVTELDSPETLEACVELALGGSKVISTYTSFDTMGALLRLSTQGLEPFLISSSNIAMVSQRLVRVLCPHCKQQDAPPKDLLNMLGLSEVQPGDAPVSYPRGCAECNQLGFQGQTAIHEILTINDAIREAILDQQPAAKIRNLARNDGKLISMAEDGYFKAVEGVTSLAEVQRVAFINEYDSQYPRRSKEILAICRGEIKEYL